MEYKKNIYTVEDGIAKITMNYPDNLNAIDMAMAEELLDILDKCEDDSNVKVVILESGGKAFSAGGDIGYFYKNIKAGGDINMDDLIERAGYVSLNIKKMSKIVITSVIGAAAGAGANLALSGDFVVCADNVKFIQAFINLGLVPDTGGSYLLSKSIGIAKAFELCATGKPLGAVEAMGLGIVNKVCSKDELEKTTMALAKQISKGPLIAYKNLKKQFFEANYTDYERYLKDGEVPTQRECISSEDFKEGVCAFIEKRKADFNGE
ncbi:enoyl-CoA hydratase/isomerase family protein [Anaerofustis stercorihominis]|uniref:Enoyl-CoA hydratase/isomerase family protein n=1 Tax=Anaerofustis stercorihominis TaxID=214853 RepID=A0A3E3DVT2_9FIRM|nr:enoyl-CoA hydratase-related protein [Anaerofustis stercorihominis]RGD73372.1 enoyl-CoA hydratase/isomerase family protein [Anaerofustis stercorihominis]